MRTSDTWRAMIAAAERDAQVLQRIQRYVERPSEELYDLEADPEELHDLAATRPWRRSSRRGRRRLEDSPLVDTP